MYVHLHICLYKYTHTVYLYVYVYIYAYTKYMRFSIFIFHSIRREVTLESSHTGKLFPSHGDVTGMGRSRGDREQPVV